MNKRSLEALGAIPALPDDLPDGLLDGLRADGINVFKISSAEPKIIHQGQYRLYEKPDGGLRIQYLRDDREVEDFIEVPGEMARIAKMASEGKMSPMDMIREVAKLMGKMR